MLLKDHNISLSTRTINRILNAHNLIQKRKKKPHRKRTSKQYKEYLRGLEVLEFDTKDLQDIQPLRRKILDKKLPRYQFTARCPKTGFSIISFGYSNDSINAGVFAAYVYSRLSALNILPKAKTDNGSEYLKRGNKGKKSNFSHIVEDIFKSEHILIPPSTPQYNGGAESFHGRIEREFYEVEDIQDEEELISKSAAYMLYYNILRPNMGNGWKTPREVLKEEFPDLSPQIFFILPIILDEHIGLIMELNKLKNENFSCNYDKLHIAWIIWLISFAQIPTSYSVVARKEIFKNWGRML